jgi:hypothetical protein
VTSLCTQPLDIDTTNKNTRRCGGNNIFCLDKKSNKKEVRIAILQDRSKRRITRNVSVGKQRQKQPTKRESAVNFCFIHGGCIIICTY